MKKYPKFEIRKLFIKIYKGEFEKKYNYILKIDSFISISIGRNKPLKTKICKKDNDP